MADRGRDLTFNLVTDQSAFDTDQAARDMQRLGDAAEDTGRQQQQMGDDATRAAGDLERLAREAEQAGRAVRGAGDDADRAGRQMGDSGEQGASRMSEAFGDARSEISGNLQEVAASFDGTVSGLIDGVQGALAPLGAAFGGIGLAVGAAASVGVGLLKAQAEQLKETVNGMVSAMIADGGRLSRDSVFAKIEEFAADESINQLAKDAELARISWEDFLLARAGDPAALERSRAALEAEHDEVVRGVQERDSAVDNLGDYTAAYLRVKDALDTSGEAQRRASDAVARYEQVTAEANEATERRTALEERAAEVTDSYAAAAGGAAEQAGELATKILEGADAYEEAQERALRAVTDLDKNTRTVYDTLGQAGVEFALAQGENADEAMQLLANAPVEQGQRIVANWQGLGASSAASVIASIRAAGPGAQAAAAELIRQVQVGLNSTPLIVRTRIDPTGYDSGLRTIVRGGAVAV